MRLHQTWIPLAALTVALSVGSVAQAAQRDGSSQDRGGRQSEGQARARSRSGDQRNDRQNAQRTEPREQRGNSDRASRDGGRRNESNGRADNRNDHRDNNSDRRDTRNDRWDRRDNRPTVNGYRGYAVPRPRVEIIRPRYNHHYGPNYSVFFGVGSGYRYGSPYYGRVYGYVPTPVYGARIYYGDVRLQVRPRNAQVFVDGYYAGIVDDFDGIFQRLTLTVGPHEIEIEAPGFEPQVYNVLVDPTRTVDVRADLYPMYP